MKSNLLVSIQFFLIFLMILPLGEAVESLYLASFFLFLSLTIGLLALSKNRVGNFNIRPDIKEDCLLITQGIYAYIRHPMYSAVLLGMFAFVLLYPTIYEATLFVLLLLTLLTKLFYEESLWKCESDEYLKYTHNTKRLIPYIF